MSVGRLLMKLIVWAESDEAMDDKTDEMMVEWFKLVRKRNEFLREESSLIYASVFFSVPYFVP